MPRPLAGGVRLGPLTIVFLTLPAAALLLSPDLVRRMVPRAVFRAFGLFLLLMAAFFFALPGGGDPRFLVPLAIYNGVSGALTVLGARHIQPPGTWGSQTEDGRTQKLAQVGGLNPLADYNVELWNAERVLERKNRERISSIGQSEASGSNSVGSEDGRRLGTNVSEGVETVSAETDADRPSLGHGGDTKDKGKPRHYWRKNEADVQRWADLFKSGLTIIHIAERENVSPDTISTQLHKVGLTVKQGHHMVDQLPLKYSPQFIELIDKGPEAVLEFVKDRVWGIQASETGLEQLRKFCEFVRLHHHGMGVKEIARMLSVHRSSVAEWREGTDQPYLIRAISDTLPITQRAGWRLLPMHLSSGGSDPSGWIQVPTTMSYENILDVIGQVQPLETTFQRAELFGLSQPQVLSMMSELFAYLLGIMVGDAGKLGGAQSRYASMNLDLQLTLKKSTNERLGEFVMMCVNSLGIDMGRIKDKPPSGRKLLGKNPSPAYRWASGRSPLLAWMFSVGLGLSWDETTTTDQVKMEWIFDAPFIFRKRFVQGTADSDGCVKPSVVEIATVPNANFFARVLHSLGMTTAHVGFDYGEPYKTTLNRKQASTLPIFNEYVNSYRHQKLMKWNEN